MAYTIRIQDFPHWRQVARQLISERRRPDSVQLLDCSSQSTLFDVEGCDDGTTGSTNAEPRTEQSFSVPKGFIELAINVGFHRCQSRWQILYRSLWRLTHGEEHLLELATDGDVLQLAKMEKEVRRDAHKMKAFVRFRRVESDGREHFVAWHQPDHRIVQKVAPFFSRRFKEMNWTILTPSESASWDQSKLTFGPGLPKAEAPAFDELEVLWKTYYANIFNPARVKIKMMKSEMPVRYWHTLPEAELIEDLIADAPRRVEEMIARREGFRQTARDFINSSGQIAGEGGQVAMPTTIVELRERAAGCQACSLCERATQTVFGVGDEHARLVIVGEQPGDVEDLAGIPFVGPAGKLLDSALAEAGIERDRVYLTNVVKHFKFTSASDPNTGFTGKKRLHQRPNAREIGCCRPWFDAEWSLLNRAEVLVCLGATAASTLIGPNFRITKNRGAVVASNYCEQTLATWHPAAILRTTDLASQTTKFAQLVEDLSFAQNMIQHDRD